MVLAFSAHACTGDGGTAPPADAFQLVITVPAAGAPSGGRFVTQPVVEVRDANGRRVTSDNGTLVTASLTPVAGQGVLVGTTAVASVGGVATFADLGLRGIAGTAYSVTFSVPGLPSVSQQVIASPGAAVALRLERSASDAPSGSPFVVQPRVEVVDAQGNVVTTATAPVTLTVSAGATAVGTTTVNAVAGTATFTTAGIGGTAGTPYTLTYASPGLAAVTQSVVPTPGLTPTRLTVITNASGAVNGIAFGTQPVVALRDDAGNIVPTSSASVTLHVDGGASVIGTTTVAAVSGVAVFSTAGLSGTAGTTYTLTFTSPGLSPTSQSVVAVAAPAAATQLAILVPAAGAASGGPFGTQPAIALRDAGGNTVTTDNGSVVTATLTPVGGSGALIGTATAQALGGVVTFADLGLTGISGTTYTLTFTRSGLPPVSQPITASPGAAVGLRMERRAVGAPSGGAFATQPRVEVVDAQGNVVTGSSAVVSMAASSGATAVGATTASAVRGTATFVTAGVRGVAGTTYTLTFSASGLGAASQTIVPVPGAVASISMPRDSTTLLLRQAQAITPVARDDAGNVVSGVVFAWGSSDPAVVAVAGDGTATALATGAAIVSASVGAIQAQQRVGVIAFASIENRCALTTAGKLYCWGANDYGAVGDGTFTDRANPVPIAPAMTFTRVYSGIHYACAIAVDGSAWCWGANANYRTVGNGSTVNENIPRAVAGGLTFRELSLQHYFTCGVTTSDAAYCWGSTPAGLSPTPAPVSASAALRTVSIGMRHACGITPAGDVLCWGENTVRQLGDTVFQFRTTPAPLFSPLQASAVAAGAYRNCAVATSGGTVCWGEGTRDPIPVPGAPPFARLVASPNHTCGLTASGVAYCWGANESGQLGNGGAPSGSGVPVAVAGGLQFRTLSAFQSSTCGVTIDFVSYCWGRFTDLSAATPTSAVSAVPQPLRLP